MGWRPESPKWCRITKPPSPDFVVERIGTDVIWRVVGRGSWMPSSGTNGVWHADVTDLARNPGDYRVICGGKAENRGGCCGGLPRNFSGAVSFHFPVREGVYDNLERLLVGYCTWQRCGHAKGWAGVCHQDPAPVKDRDGRVVRTVDVRGGYHQSADLRCWHDGVSTSLYNLLRYAERGTPEWDVDGDLVGNIRWGCDYFLKVISPEGYLYDCQFVPIGWGPRDYYARPSCLGAHANVIMLFARASRYFAESDSAYGARLLAAAKRLQETVETDPFFETAPRDFVRNLPPGTQPESWYTDQFRSSAVGLSERAGAALELYRATHETKYAQLARRLGLDLCRHLGPDGRHESFSGCGYAHAASGYSMPTELYLEFGDAAFRTAALAVAARMLREVEAEDYGAPLPRMSSSWLLTRARILAQDARVFGRADLRVAAQRALDWILGANPMCSSYVEGAGQNQWQRPVFGQFFPSTPQIPGGILHFWGGEYDMPPTTLALWTLAELYPTPEMLLRNPPREAGVGVWWHWMGGQVTEEGILRDLDWFRATGIFSATVFGLADSCTPWAKRIGDIPTDGLHPFDERWWKLFAFACREGQARGIDIGLHNCPGYTSTGGPWIPSRLAMRELVFGVTNAALQVSTTPRAIYPVYNEDSKRFELPACPARQTDVVEIGVARGGVRVAHVPMGAFVQPADWATFGLECDKMNPEAVDFHLDHVLGALKRHLGDDLPAAGLKHILLDSYEAGVPNWTPCMREEFRSRRGYDPLEFLPILGGRTNLYSTAEVVRFREDFDRTLKDLYRDILFRRMSARLHAEGLDFSCEPYQGPFEPREVSPFIDRLMTEFWYSPKGTSLYRDGHRLFNTFPGPNGERHNVIEAEAFTGRPQACEWTEMPANLKPAADDAFLSGVNRLILHSNPLQPWGDDIRPGVTMGRWGVHFGRNQTWAVCGKAWYDYLARCQALLQWGRPCESARAYPFACRQISRTDGMRTVSFVVKTDGRSLFHDVTADVWYDPLTGRRLREEPCGQTLELTDFTPALGDRTQSDDPAARYFSGTLTYRTRFDVSRILSRAVLRLDARTTYDQVFAVRVNGVPAGVSWCAPWEIELPVAALREGKNDLEIDVTNSWRNRLIGDEQEPADCAFEKAPEPGGSYLVRYPDWFGKGLSARPSKGRRCFTTWNYFTRESPLTPSGLVSPPVVMASEVLTAVAEGTGF